MDEQTIARTKDEVGGESERYLGENGRFVAV